MTKEIKVKCECKTKDWPKNEGNPFETINGKGNNIPAGISSQDIDSQFGDN